MPGVAVGDRIADRYRLLEEIGSGGMGVVYRARDEVAARDVAVKVLRAEATWDLARRLRREARAANALDPRRVAHVHEVGRTPDGVPFLVMEYIPGASVRSLVRRGKLARVEALRIVREIATTLGEAHRAHIVHRDVKPDNVIVGDDGRVVLLDFGIAKTVVADGAAHDSTQLTREGTLLGTPAYLAPEQALGNAIGPEADQFALAVTAFELLTGSSPWGSLEPTQILARVLAGEAAVPSRVDPASSAAHDLVFARALARRKQDRFGTVEEFAAALDAADRGEAPEQPSSTRVASAHTRFDEAGGEPTPGKQRLLTALGVLALGAAIAAPFLRARSEAPRPVAASDPAEIVRALASPEARVACPPFEVRGVPDIASPLGAAAATFACERVRWFVGGRDDRVVPAAELLGVPVQPVEGFADPYAAPGVRESALALARTTATAYLDGAVARDRQGWLASVALRAPDGREVARAEGRDEKLFALAIKRAVDPLWRSAALAPASIDPDVARWTAYPDAEIGLASADLFQIREAPEACALLNRRWRELGNAYYFLAAGCPGRPADVGAPSVDESSTDALVTSVRACIEWNVPIAPDEMRRLAQRLEDARAHEASRFGRALAAETAGTLWGMVNEPSRAQLALLAAIQEDPLVLDAWQELVDVSRTLGSTDVAPVAAAWFPTEAKFHPHVGSMRGDELAARLRDARLAYVLDPGLLYALALGRALAEVGRADEARAIAGEPVGGASVNERLQRYVLTFVDLHDARFGSALDRLAHGGLPELVVVADVMGVLRETATGWATRFLAASAPEAKPYVLGNTTSIALCMHADRAIALRCLDRVRTIAHAERNWWGDGGEELLAGAERYARGDVRGAVDAWRRLVAGPTLDIVRVLPTDAFERAGEQELAARLDARKMAFTFLAGVSDAAPREAQRAFAAGDRARAADLARKVVAAWETADVSVPAVARMRALLAN